MKKNELKIIDLLILSILAFITECLGYLLVSKLNTPFYLSFSLAICIIAIVRWGIVGVATYCIAGCSLVYLKGEGNYFVSFLYESLANLAICIPFIVVFKREKNRNKVVDSTGKFLMILLTCILSLCICKGVILVIFNNTITGIIDYFASSLLINVVNVLLLLLLAHKKNQILIDMEIYLTKDCRNQED